MTLRPVTGVLRRTLRYPLAWLASAAAGARAMIVAFAVTLSVPLVSLTFFLTMATTALVSAIAANAVSNLLAPDGTRGRLLPVVGATEGAAVVVAVGLRVIFLIEGDVALSPLIVPLLVCVALIALSATVASALLRTTEGNVRDDFWIAARLLALAFVVVFVAAPTAGQVLCRAVVSCAP